MALSFSSVATHATPAGPRCFRISSGILLSPGLLFALNRYFNDSESSAYVMCYVVASFRALN